MANYAKAKDTAMERAALDAYNAHFFKCTPSCSVADWTTAWKKAVAWWTEVPAAEASKPKMRRRLTSDGNGGMCIVTEPEYSTTGQVLLAALREALPYIESHEDVRGGADGEQLPNQAMQLAQTLRAAISSATGSQ